MWRAQFEPFDAGALYVAMDERRAQLGLSWTGAAAAIWQQSAELNSRRHDHPISPSTLTGVAGRRATSCQHALFMLRWLGRSPESFLAGASGDDSRFALPIAGPDRRLRWSLKLLHASLDEQRRDQALTWAALGARLGCSPSQLTGLRTAKFATGMQVAMSAVQWLDRPAADFVYAARW